MTSSFLKNYDASEEVVRKLYDSRIRLAILDALQDKPLRLADLRREIGANAPNTSTKAKDLEDMGLVERVGGDYALTPYGKATLKRISDGFEFYATYEKFKGFWSTHNTSEIPNYLWVRLGELNDSTIVRNENLDVIKNHDFFVDFLNGIESSFYGVSPIFRKEWVPISEKLIAKGVHTEIIVTKEVLKLSLAQMVNVPARIGSWAKSNKGNLPEAVSSGLRGIGGKLKELQGYKNLKLYVIEEPPTTAFTVSESTLSLSLQNRNSLSIDMSSDLYCKNPSGVKWGLDLFDYYKKKSRPVKLTDYL